MPDALRSPYDGDLRAALLAAALDEIERAGPSGVSLRAIARDVGVSHAAPKNHFASKQALFTVIATEGHDLLAAAMADAPEGRQPPLPVADRHDAVAQLVAAGRGYLRFAQAHPAHFAVMFRDDLLDHDDDELIRASTATLGYLATRADASTHHLDVAPGDLPTLVLLAWSLVHGLASLHATADLQDIVGATSRSDVDDAVIDLMARLLRPGAG